MPATCSTCLWLNPASLFCPKKGRDVEAADAACRCHAARMDTRPSASVMPNKNNQQPIVMQENEHEIQTKVCKSCNQEKPLSEFSAHNRAKDGHRSVCKQCEGKGRMPAKMTEEHDTVPKSQLADLTDRALVKELRRRGWDVKCSKTIVVEL